MVFEYERMTFFILIWTCGLFLGVLNIQSEEIPTSLMKQPAVCCPRRYSCIGQDIPFPLFHRAPPRSPTPFALPESPQLQLPLTIVCGGANVAPAFAPRTVSWAPSTPLNTQVPEPTCAMLSTEMLAERRFHHSRGQQRGIPSPQGDGIPWKRPRGQERGPTSLEVAPVQGRRKFERRARAGEGQLRRTGRRYILLPRQDPVWGGRGGSQPQQAKECSEEKLHCGWAGR